MTPTFQWRTQTVFGFTRRRGSWKIMRVLFCLAAFQIGQFSSSQAGDIDPLIWTRNFTNLCLQEAYSKPNAVETLFFVGQTANSLCDCGGRLMGATITKEEIAFYLKHEQMRGDTKMRWRQGLAQCSNRKLMPPTKNVVTANSFGG